MHEDFDKYLIKFYNKNIKTCWSQMIVNLFNFRLIKQERAVDGESTVKS